MEQEVMKTPHATIAIENQNWNETVESIEKGWE